MSEAKRSDATSIGARSQAEGCSSPWPVPPPKDLAQAGTEPGNDLREAESESLGAVRPSPRAAEPTPNKVVAALGGILVSLGGILGFLLRLGPRGFGPGYPGYYGVASALAFGVLAVIFGLIILVCSGYTRRWIARRNMASGVILVVIGIVTWLVLGSWLLVAIGSFLTVVAGLVLLAELLLTNPRLGAAPSS